MIGKVAASGSGFRGVVNYLLLGRKDEPNPDRVAWFETRNLLVDDPDLAPRVMRATAVQSARCRKPVYHLAIAWHHDENPTDDVMRAVGDQTLKDLQLDEHQALFIAHKDTAHKHLHIVVNRVNPETGKAWSNSNDYKRIEISLRQQAEARGLPYVPGRFNDPEKFAGKGRAVKDGEFQANVRHDKPPPKPPWGTDDIKALRAVLVPAFDEATTWDGLDAELGALGFRLAPKGQGLIIEGADGFMKLSDLGKGVRMNSLEEAFGEPFAAFEGRRMPRPDQSLKNGANILVDVGDKSRNPGQSSRRAPPLIPLQSPPNDSSGDQDGFSNIVREETKPKRTAKPIRLPRKIKAAGADSDDGVPAGGKPQIETDPKKRAFNRVRAARADIARLKQANLEGNADGDQVLDAQLRLDAARQDLEALLAEDRDRPAPRPSIARPITPRRETEPVRPRIQQRKEPDPLSVKDDPAASRSEAFVALRSARQAEDIAVALFNAGVISREELATAADDVRRAAEQLRPHLSFEEQLKKDIADALRGKPGGGKPKPKKGEPGR